MEFFEAFFCHQSSVLIDGLRVTIEVSVLSIIFSFLIGGLAGVLRFTNIPFFSKIFRCSDRCDSKPAVAADYFLHVLCIAADRYSFQYFLVCSCGIDDF